MLHASMAESNADALIRPVSYQINALGHIEIGACDLTQLAAKFGTPLWVLDESTIIDSIQNFKSSLFDSYPYESNIYYAGKAFLCTAMCQIVKNYNLGLDIVSGGELYTAKQVNFPAEKICFHGNNKGMNELSEALEYGDVLIVVDNYFELETLAKISAGLGKKARILVRVIPGIEPDTHDHIKTGHCDSKFGVSIDSLFEFVSRACSYESLELLGLHAHIGSQTQDLAPYLDNVEVLAKLASELKARFGFETKILDVGGGLGVKYTKEDEPPSITDWTKAIAHKVCYNFQKLDMSLPRLVLEPGRAIVARAGLTLYKVGSCKLSQSGREIVSVDGGMADNPRPITYQSKYSASLANRQNEVLNESLKPLQSLVGKFCESGDILIKEIDLSAKQGDLVAVFVTGAYNFSMASNYNRSCRPACVLVSNGQAETIVERETYENIISRDRIPQRLLVVENEI